MSAQSEVVLTCAVILALALLPLRFRDKFRNLGHLSEEERLRSRARNAVGTTALTRIIWAVAGAYLAFAPGTAVRIRFVCGLAAVYFAASFWTTLQVYRKLAG
jgi:hypothetical protein